VLNPFFGKRIGGAPEFLQNGLGLLVSRPPMFEIASARLHRVFRCAAGLERDTEIHLDLVAQLMQGAAVVHGSAFYELPQNLFAFDDCREAKGDDRGLLEDPLQDLAEIFHHFRKVPLMHARIEIRHKTAQHTHVDSLNPCSLHSARG